MNRHLRSQASCGSDTGCWGEDGRPGHSPGLRNSKPALAAPQLGDSQSSCHHGHRAIPRNPNNHPKPSLWSLVLHPVHDGIRGWLSGNTGKPDAPTLPGHPWVVQIINYTQTQEPNQHASGQGRWWRKVKYLKLIGASSEASVFWTFLKC